MHKINQIQSWFKHTNDKTVHESLGDQIMTLTLMPQGRAPNI